MISSELQDQASQQNASAVQQPRNDLQPTAATVQAAGNDSANNGAVPQQQLAAPTLRVGNSQSVVANTTRTQVSPVMPPAATHPLVLLWLLIPILLVVMLLLPRRRSEDTLVIEQPATAAPVVPSSSKKKKKSTKRKKSKH